ncbi:hypothetical protein [Brevibacillus massiliensis]|nr:hypothetical protein [Brevibacillus massiliensis]
MEHAIYFAIGVGILLLAGTALLLSSWIKGREALAKERKRELNKIKIMNL